MFSRGFGYFHTTNKEFVERFEKLELEVSQKLDTSVYKTKAKKTKKKLRDEVLFSNDITKIIRWKTIQRL